MKRLKAEGKNPFTLDSKEPDGTLREFLSGEIRYASLEKTFPQEADKLHARLEEEFMERYEKLKKMAEEAPEKGADQDSDTQSQDAGIDDPTCTISSTAEHSRMDNLDESCDDGRAGKI